MLARMRARLMLGAVNEFVAASARERLAHGRAKVLSDIASDPGGARSAQGDPKLGAPTALLESDPKLMETMKTYAEMPAEERPTYNQIAKELKKKNKKWAMQKKGKNKGKPRAAKQICMFLVRINAAKGVKKKLKAPSSSTTATKGKKATAKGQSGNKGASQKARQKAKPRNPPEACAPRLGGTTWSASERASALKGKRGAITLPFAKSGKRATPTSTP